MGISPIIVHVHEKILHDLSGWTSLLSDQIDKLQFIMTTARANVGDESTASLDQPSYPDMHQDRSSLSMPSSTSSSSLQNTDFDGSVYLDALLYEICFSIDVEKDPSASSEATGTRYQTTPSGRRSSALTLSALS